MQQQLTQRNALRLRHEAARVTPAFSHRTAPQSFKPCVKPQTTVLKPAGPGGIHTSESPIRLQAVARPSVFFFNMGGDDDDFEEEYTVLKVQVGLFGDVRKWQEDMERLSELFDTEDEESLHFILQETVTKLLRNMEYCSYGQTAGKVFDNLEDCERKFNEVSLDERAKFKEETYSNVDGRRRRRAMDVTASSETGLDKWLCATILVAMEGKVKPPKINSSTDMRKALKMLGGVTPDTLLAFELLWTPQAEGDSYSKDELLQDFPSLAVL